MKFNIFENMPWNKKNKEEEKLPDAAELKTLKDNLPKFLKSKKGLEALKKARELMALMQKEGVNIKDEKAVKAWLEKRGPELEKAPAPAKAEPFVNKAAEVGRNEPCTCGSGKKFKKCHGAVAA